MTVPRLMLTMIVMLSGLQSAVAYGAVRYCSHQFIVAKTHGALANLVTDENHVAIEYSVSIFLAKGVTMTWVSSSPDIDLRSTPSQLKLPSIEFARETPFPIGLDVLVDDRKIWAGLFDYPTSEIISFVPDGSQPAKHRRVVKVGIDRSLPGAALKRFRLGRLLEVRARSEHGKTLRNVLMEQPNWRSTIADAQRAMTIIEGDRRAGRCHVPAPPVAD